MISSVERKEKKRQKKKCVCFKNVPETFGSRCGTRSSHQSAAGSFKAIYEKARVPATKHVFPKSCGGPQTKFTELARLPRGEKKLETLAKLRLRKYSV